MFRRRKYQRKQDLAALKATWRLGQQISADTKDLDDIPHYWPQRQARGLPLIQYTAREVRSGLQFLAFAQRRSAGASALFAYRIQSHLAACGLDLANLVWQTDNGGEFIGALEPDGSRSGFPRAVTFFGSQHERIPPAAHTYQSDVETVHRLIEDEFYNLETFRSRREFLAKACVYQCYFNLVRPNSHKGDLSPWQIIQQLDPHLSLKLCLLPPVFLDYRLDSQGGYDVPRYPSFKPPSAARPTRPCTFRDRTTQQYARRSRSVPWLSRPNTQLRRTSGTGHLDFALALRLRSSSKASSGEALSCTTARTAWIIAAPSGDWKMFRPMSTPTAPAWMAL